ncbi:hypothetical protein [Fibrella arboris]|uniref:hypothetical protein n=1 Tax=Fibrella arboris TaxID=3242486 RepID=UPI0035202BF1
MKKSKVINGIRLLFWVILIVNLPPVCNVIQLFGNEYGYITKQGRQFEENQFAANRYEEVFVAYIVTGQEPGYENDAPLYRTEPINPLRFWRWYDYAVHPRWRLPYNDQPDTLKKGPVNVNPEKLRLWKRIHEIDGY